MKKMKVYSLCCNKTGTSFIINDQRNCAFDVEQQHFI